MAGILSGLSTELLKAFLDSEDLEHTRSYLQAGRAYRDLPVAELEAAWLKSWRDFYLSNVATACDTLGDCDAEFRLRALPSPDHLIDARDRERALDGTAEAVERDVAMQEQLADELDAFGEMLARPKH
jgi:hypothetical protein